MSEQNSGIIRKRKEGLLVDTNHHGPASLSHTGGDYWCESFTAELRKAGLLETKEAVFPWVSRDQKNHRYAVFRLVNNERELSRKSVPLSGSGAKIPNSQLDALEAGMKRLRERANETDGDLRTQLKDFRLPPPHSPYYRVTREGFFPWSRCRLVILWGLRNQEHTATPGHPDAAAFGFLRNFEAPERSWLDKLRWFLLAPLFLVLLALIVSGLTDEKNYSPPRTSEWDTTSSNDGSSGIRDGGTTGLGPKISPHDGGEPGGPIEPKVIPGESPNSGGPGKPGGSTTRTEIIISPPVVDPPNTRTEPGLIPGEPFNGSDPNEPPDSKTKIPSPGDGERKRWPEVVDAPPPPHWSGISVSIASQILSPNADGTIRTKLGVSAHPSDKKITRVEWIVDNKSHPERGPNITLNLPEGRHEVRAKVHIENHSVPFDVASTISVARNP